METVPVEAERALAVVGEVLGDSLVAAYLHGSAVSGGLRPHSDVDVLAVVEHPTTRAMRAGLVSGLMKISGHPDRGGDARPLELIIFRRADLVDPPYPARSEFVYGEWLREAFEAGEVPGPGPDPELTVLLAQARQEARAMWGPAPAEMLPVILPEDVRRAIGDALPPLLASLEGDERNVLLTLARMWRTLASGEIVSKDAAAEWAMARLPPEAAGLLGRARDAYLGGAKVDWAARSLELRRAVDELRGRVTGLA